RDHRSVRPQPHDRFGVSGGGGIVLGESGLFDPTAPLTASGNLRRRMVVNGVVRLTATLAALAAVAILAIIVYHVIVRGASSLGLSFVTQAPQGLAEGGIVNFLIGTLEVVALGAVIALPLGILT